MLTLSSNISNVRKLRVIYQMVYKNLVIKSLVILIKYFKNKNFRQLARSDIISYLDSLHKSEEVDPLHKWIGTYNLKRQLFLKFFKWLHHPIKEAKKKADPQRYAEYSNTQEKRRVDLQA